MAYNLKISDANLVAVTKDLEYIGGDAEYFEFVLNTRTKSEEYEELFLRQLKKFVKFSVDRDFKNYENYVCKHFSEQNPPELAEGKHYRRWILILHFGDATLSGQLSRIREKLNHDRKKYHEYALSMQRLYGIFSKDFSGRSMHLKYYKKANVPLYLNALLEEVKMGVTIFIDTEEELKNPS